MSIKSKVLASAAALSAVAGGLGVAGVATAHAATPPCGARCIEITNNGGALDVYKRVSKTGQKVILWGESNTDPALDFTASLQGTVHQFYKAGLASSALNLHYSKDTAWEIQYAPDGVPSHLCVGVTAANGSGVTLQPCGVTAKTTWVVDYHHGDLVLINGSDANFSDPFVLTDNGGSLLTAQENTYADGTVFDNQIWSYTFGVVQ